jgi:hypothetical protein
MFSNFSFTCKNNYYKREMKDLFEVAFLKTTMFYLDQS